MFTKYSAKFFAILAMTPGYCTIQWKYKWDVKEIRQAYEKGGVRSEKLSGTWMDPKSTTMGAIDGKWHLFPFNPHILSAGDAYYKTTCSRRIEDAYQTNKRYVEIKLIQDKFQTGKKVTYLHRRYWFDFEARLCWLDLNKDGKILLRWEIQRCVGGKVNWGDCPRRKSKKEISVKNRSQHNSFAVLQRKKHYMDIKMWQNEEEYNLGGFRVTEALREQQREMERQLGVFEFKLPNHEPKSKPELMCDCKEEESSPEAPYELCCPISLEIMRNPVKCKDGHFYEREAIEEFFRTQKAKNNEIRSPMTGMLMEEGFLEQWFSDLGKLKKRIRKYNKAKSKRKVPLPRSCELLD